MSLLRARWGYQTGLLQWRMPAFWLFAVLLLVTGLIVAVVQVVYAATTPTGWLLSWALMILYIVPVALVVRWLDLYEREPRSLVIGAFLWGGVVAIIFSGFANVAWGSVIVKLAGAEFASDWSAALTAPVVEETYKVLGVVVLYLIARPEMDDLMDGFVLGATIGLGFDVVEDVDYFINAFGGSIGGVLEGFWVRVIASGLYGHVLYTGIAGIGVAYFVTRREERPLGRRLLVAGGSLLLAIAAHFFWNSPIVWEELPLLAATTVKGLPFLIVLVIALRLARRQEHRWLAAALKSEVGRPGLTAEELATLRDPGSRKQALTSVGMRAGPQAAALLKELQREQVDLSMVATRVDRPDHLDLVRQRNLVRSLRERLWAMPGVLEALGVPAATAESVRAMPVEVPWEPDAVVPAVGLAAWMTPDATRPPDGRLPPGLPLMVTRRAGEWAEVQAANGWKAWVDARLLVQQRRTHWR